MDTLQTITVDAKVLLADFVVGIEPDVVADVTAFNTEAAGNLLNAGPALAQLEASLLAQAPAIAAAWAKQVNTVVALLGAQIAAQAQADTASLAASTGATGPAAA